MDDNEIIQALECCSQFDCNNCNQLHNGIEHDYECKNHIIETALDLINRQKQELTELRVIAEENNDKLNSVIDCQKAKIEELKFENSMIHKLYKEVCEHVEYLDSLNKRLKEDKTDVI